MAETSVQKLPYPVDGDAPNGPAQIKALADRLEVLLNKRQTVRQATKNKLNNGEAEAFSITWPTAFADTNYTVSLSVERVEGPGVTDISFYGKVKTGITVNVLNASGGASVLNVEATAVHD